MKKILVASMTLAALLVACNEPAQKEEKAQAEAPAVEQPKEVKAPGMDQVAEEVDQLDAELETLLSEI